MRCRLRILMLIFVVLAPVISAQEAVFKVGVAKRDITPPAGIPMWGYGDRHDALATGMLDPLYAKAVVIETGSGKLALVGLDLGRGPLPRTGLRQRDSPKERCRE